MLQTLSTEKSDILTGLNPAQYEAVTTIKGPVLIIAGAGSGKTKALTHRIANIIQNGVNPSNILALTFTNKAAKEMKERIAHLVSYDKSRYIWAGTFHSIFAKILRIEAAAIGYSANFSIYDTDDSNSLIKKILKDDKFRNKKILASSVRGKISNLKNSLVTPAEYLRNADTSDKKTISEIYVAYERELRLSNAMDFDDLLVNFIVLLRSSKDTLNKYQNMFKYLLIDEYQDTNMAQYIAVQMLANAHQNICVVGDDAQSIYRWRGADISNILNFEQDYPYAKVIRLEQNYRSTQTILDAAHNIIKNNKKQIPKTLWTQNGKGDLINIYQAADDRQEAFYISNLIKSEIAKGKKYRDLAVLYRTNAQSLSIENSLRSNKIPYTIVGGISFYKRKEIKDVVAYITLLVNPNDNEAFSRAINEPPRGIGETSLKHLKNYSFYNNISMLKACEEIEYIPEIKGKAASSAKEFGLMVQKYAELMNYDSIPAVVQEFLKESGIINMYEDIASDETFDRLNNINQLITDLSVYFKNNNESTLAEYLQQISLTSDIDEKDFSANSVTLMTIHSAKGLEFQTVVIAGMEKGLFPLEREKFVNNEELEEERRLFYVGVTRAKQSLYLTYAIRRARFGENITQTASQFLKEIPPFLVSVNQSTGISPGVNNTQRMSFKEPAMPKSYNFEDNYSQIPAEENYSQMPVSQEGLKPGDRVRHISFGNGKIVLIEGFGQQQKVTVSFDSIGVKKMMLAYAKLQKL